MSKPVPYLIQGKNVILAIDGKSYTINKETHISYAKIVDALKAKDWDALRDLVEPAKALTTYGNGHITIDSGVVSWKGHPIHNALTTRIIEMFQEGFPIEPMVRFMSRLMMNPSKRSIDQLYSFLEKNNLPITEDGYFLAFKKVSKNYMDIHSGTISNAVGKVITMDRNLVDDNPDSHCSVGLHFCSESYLKHFGNSTDPVMILKIDPANVVSIPTDYNGAKGRCCAYEVVAEVQGDPATTFSTIINKAYSAPTKSVDEPVAAPKAAWPYPTSNVIAKSKVVKAAPAKQVAPKLYDLRRVRGNLLEYSGLNLNDARDMVAKHVRQKKAALYVVEHGTNNRV